MSKITKRHSFVSKEKTKIETIVTKEGRKTISLKEETKITKTEVSKEHGISNSTKKILDLSILNSEGSLLRKIITLIMYIIILLRFMWYSYGLWT